MKMTDYENGTKNPADLIGTPDGTAKGRRYPVLPRDERERRMKRLSIAIERAGHKLALAKGIGVSHATVVRWDTGKLSIHDEQLEKIEAFLAGGLSRDVQSQLEGEH